MCSLNKQPVQYDEWGFSSTGIIEKKLVSNSRLKMLSGSHRSADRIISADKTLPRVLAPYF